MRAARRQPLGPARVDEGARGQGHGGDEAARRHALEAPRGVAAARSRYPVVAGEVRLAIEPTAAGFAAVRAADHELRRIATCLGERREAVGSPAIDRLIDLDLAFQAAVVEASHNPLLVQLSASIRGPFRVALALTSRFPASVRLGLEAHEVLLESLRRHDPLGARRAAEEVVGLAMLAVEKGLRSARRPARKDTK